jgi:hypothetical protein
MNKTIFVSIASYKDFDVVNTIIDCFNKANNPNNVFIGVCLQDTEVEQKRITDLINNHLFYLNVKFMQILASDAQGCGWARNLIMENLYNNEDYFLCVDSHSRFLIGWDDEYINQLSEIPSKGVISVFPQIFEFNETYDVYSKRNVATIYTSNAPTWTPEFIPPHCMRHPIDGYEKVMNISGGNLFGSGEIVNILKVNEYYNPTKEQEIYSLLLFKSGYDVFAIRKNIIWHKYIPNYNSSYRELCNWSKFNPNMDFVTGLKDYGGTERTTLEWVNEVYKECTTCKK